MFRYPPPSWNTNDYNQCYGRSQCSPQYEDSTLTPNDRERLRQRTDRNISSKYRNYCTQRASTQVRSDLNSTSRDEDNGITAKEQENQNRKNNFASQENAFIEDKIRAGIQKLFEDEFVKRKQQEAEREKDEMCFEAHKVFMQRAFEDQAASFREKAENQKLAVQAEIELLRQKEKANEERFNEAVAAKVEAERKADEEKACKIRESLERDAIEEEKRRAQAVQDAEAWHIKRSMQEADEKEAKRIATMDKIAAENTAKVFELTRSLISMLEAKDAMKNKKVPETTKSRKTGVLDDSLRELILEIKKLLDSKPEKDLRTAAELGSPDGSLGEGLDEQESLVQVELDTKHQTTSLNSEGISQSNAKTQSLEQELKREIGINMDAAKHRNKNAASEVKERSRHGKHKDERKEKKVSEKSQDRAVTAMRWFAT